jgi:hypothetical protein
MVIKLGNKLKRKCLLIKLGESVLVLRNFRLTPNTSNDLTPFEMKNYIQQTMLKTAYLGGNVKKCSSKT